MSPRDSNPPQTFVFTKTAGHKTSLGSMMHCRVVNPPLLQILRIDREGMTDDVITDGT